MENLREKSEQWSPTGVMLRFAILAAIWLVLSQGEFRYWGLVAFAVLVSTFVSLLVAPSIGLGWSFVGLARFIPFFLWQSLVGGVDVAMRALARPTRVDPVYVEYPFRVASEPARVTIANVMSLMPGSQSVSIDEHRMRMHVLDRSMSAYEQARRLEIHIARVFNLPLADEPLAPDKPGD